MPYNNSTFETTTDYYLTNSNDYGIIYAYDNSIKVRYGYF
jgi:hypothetical protein